MTLPYTHVVQAVRTAASRSGALRVDRLVPALVKDRAVSSADAAVIFTRLALGPAPDPVAIGELTLELSALGESARSLACVLAPALDGEAVVTRALVGIGAACGAAIGAIVPVAVVIDATLLEACRESGAQWDASRLTPKRGVERAEELARRAARSLGVGIEGETPQQSETRLRALDLALAESAARAAEIEKKLRASLPKV